MKITLMPYNSYWPDLFKNEKQLLLEKSGNTFLSIEHIGSTAIPGILAKPVIDIIIGVADLNKFDHDSIELIKSLEYKYIKDYEEHLPNRRYFQKDDSDGNRTYQIHLVNYNSAWWQRHILFRDYMRRHIKEANAYTQLKLELTELLNKSVESTDAKKQFFDKFIYPYPSLNKEYKNLVQLLGDNLSLTNLYAIAKSPFIQKINAKAFFDFKHHLPNITLPRLNGYILQLACLNIYKQMFQDPDFVQCYGVKLNDSQLQSILERDTTYWDKYGFGPYAWFDKKHQSFIGEGGLNHTTIGSNQEIELTYSLSKKYWGRGIAAEIGKFAIDTAFNTLGLNSIVCFTMTENHQSLRVIEKLGFKFEKDFIHFNLPHKLFRLNRDER